MTLSIEVYLFPLQLNLKVLRIRLCAYCDRVQIESFRALLIQTRRKTTLQESLVQSFVTCQEKESWNPVHTHPNLSKAERSLQFTKTGATENDLKGNNPLAQLSNPRDLFELEVSALNSYITFKPISSLLLHYWHWWFPHGLRWKSLKSLVWILNCTQHTLFESCSSLHCSEGEYLFCLMMCWSL